jgi:hypothetical protein
VIGVIKVDRLYLKSKMLYTSNNIVTCHPRTRRSISPTKASPVECLLIFLSVESVMEAPIFIIYGSYEFRAHKRVSRDYCRLIVMCPHE